MKILLIKRGAMGDILMSTPLIRHLRINFPNAVIDYCLAQPFTSTLKDNPYLNKVIGVDDKVFTRKGMFAYIKFVWSIRKEYDYIFNLGKSWQLNLLNLLFCGQKIGYVRERISKLLLNKHVVYNDIMRYHGLYYLDLLKASCLVAMPDYNDISLDLIINAEDKLIVEAKLSELGIIEYDVVVNSGGNNQYESGGARMLPQDKIEQLLTCLLGAKRKVILLGGNVDRDNYSVYASIDPTNIINYAGVFNLAQSTYLISMSAHFYTTDCGAMHLGVIANMDSRMTCFFGPTAPSHVLPPNKKFNIIWEDQDIFNADYPLSGRLSKNLQGYFKRLDMKNISRR